METTEGTAFIVYAAATAALVASVVAEVIVDSVVDINRNGEPWCFCWHRLSSLGLLTRRFNRLIFLSILLEHKRNDDEDCINK